MPLDPSIALQVQSPNPGTMISQFLDIGQKGLDFQKSQALMQPQIQQGIAQSQSAQEQAEQAHLETIRQHASNALQSAMAMYDKPNLQPEDLAAQITQYGKKAGASDQAISMAVDGLPKNTGDPEADHKAAQGWLAQRALAARSLLEQINAKFPAPGIINNGQQQVPVAAGNAALTGVPAGTPQGAPVQNLLPPNTPVMRGNQPGYLGTESNQPPGRAIGSGPTLGQVEGVAGQVAPNVAHFNGVIAAANEAPTRIGILQEIKTLAPEAMTGDAPMLKKIVSKLAGYTGWTGSEQTPTDVMAKESAMLAAKSGNTDLARLLGEAATPNGHMTKDAIKKTADQLIGQENAKLAAQQYFTGTPPDSPVYREKLTAWNANADPRIFEFAAKDPADRAVMKAELVRTGQWPAFRSRMLQLHVMGVQPPEAQ